MPWNVWVPASRRFSRTPACPRSNWPSCFGSGAPSRDRRRRCQGLSRRTLTAAGTQTPIASRFAGCGSGSQRNETTHELDKRLAAIIRHGHLSPSQADDLMRAITALVEIHIIEIIPRDFYEQVESVARRRIPRDPQDWPTVALAIVLDAPIPELSACRFGHTAP